MERITQRPATDTGTVHLGTWNGARYDAACGSRSEHGFTPDGATGPMCPRCSAIETAGRG